MGRYPQPANGHGSLKRIQEAVNLYPQRFSRLVAQKLMIGQNTCIHWVSPLKNDCYAEYRDKAFLDRLGLKPQIPLSRFWPRQGPQWDALGTDGKTVFLFEAKANIPELASSCSAKSKESLALITSSLDAVKRYIGASEQADWLNGYYQYVNRIAHLYYLRVVNQIPAYLVFVYFLGDKTVNGPHTELEWRKELENIHSYLGLPTHHLLSAYIADVFIPV